MLLSTYARTMPTFLLSTGISGWSNLLNDTFYEIEEENINSLTFTGKVYSYENNTLITHQFQIFDKLLILKNENYFEIFILANSLVCNRYPELKKLHNEISLFSFTLKFQEQLIEFYTDLFEECLNYINIFQKVLKQRFIEDYYIIHTKFMQNYYKAEHRYSKDSHLVKIIHKDKDFNKSVLQLCIIMNNPNIIKHIDHFEDMDNLYIVYEDIETDLLTFLKTNKLSDFEYLNLIKQIANGLEYLHTLGITHRAIKPENIVITYNSGLIKAKIINFDMSIISNEYSHFDYIPGYHLPEINYNTQNIDIWSFGVLIYFMYLGKFPFELNKKISKIRFDKNIPLGIKNLIQTCLKINTPDIGEILSLLERM
jgi:hypothetical protein